MRWQSHEDLDHVFVKAGEAWDNKFGHFEHDSVIGRPWGSKIYSKDRKGWILALKPTPELWTNALSLRTQIIQDLDQAMITYHLHLKPGMTVVESGTGSGAMSMSIMRCIAPTGRLFTFEFNEARAEEAKREFTKCGLDTFVTVTHRNACNDGFLPEAPDGRCDAVFLDLPQPQLAVGHALRVLKPNGRIGSYSPCIEQVSATCEAMRDLGFHSIVTMEARQKLYEPLELQLLEQGMLDPDAPEAGGEGEKAEGAEGNGEAEGEKGGEGEGNRGEGEEEARRPAKKKRRDPEKDAALKRHALTTKLYAKPVPSMRGHTAYLTFAYAPLPAAGAEA